MRIFETVAFAPQNAPPKRVNKMPMSMAFVEWLNAGLGRSGVLAIAFAADFEVSKVLEPVCNLSLDISDSPRIPKTSNYAAIIARAPN